MSGIKKRICFYLCILLSVICIGLFVCEQTKSKTYAEETAVFQMEEGVSYRNCWSEPHCGLTYTATINKTYYDNFISNNSVTPSTVKINLLLVPYEYINGLGSSTVAKFATAKSYINQGKYAEGFAEAKNQGAKFWYGIVDDMTGGASISEDTILKGGLKTIQTENANRRYFGIYYVEGQKSDGTVVRQYASLSSANKTANSLAYVVSSLTADNRNDWETKNINTFLKRSVEGALKASVSSEDFENLTLSDDLSGRFEATMGTVSGVTADNVTSVAGDITYGDDTFYHNFYARYTLNDQTKIVDVTDKLDFNAFWTINDADYLQQNTANKKDVEVKNIGNNKKATLKLGTGTGFVAKTLSFNTKKLTSAVDMTVDGKDITVDRISEFYSSSPTAKPTKITATLKANGTTRLKDKTYTYTISSSSATTESGYKVQSYSLSGFENSTLKAKISTSDYASKLDITSSTFNRSGQASGLENALNVDCNLYNFTATNSDLSVKMNRYTISYSADYTDLSGENDKITASAQSSLKSYYFADENINLNSGKSDSLTMSTGGYTFNGFVKDTAFTSDFFSESNLNKNYMVSRGSFHMNYNLSLVATEQEKKEGYSYRNHAVIMKKVKAGTKITFNSFTYNGSAVKYGIILATEMGVHVYYTNGNNLYDYDSGWLTASGQAKVHDKGITNEYVKNSDGTATYTVDGTLYQNTPDRQYTLSKKFDYVYVMINVMYDTNGNVTKTENTDLIKGALKNISVDGIYQENVNTGDTDIDKQTLTGSYYVSQGSFGITDTTNADYKKRMKIVITRPVKKGTVISWNSNTVSDSAFSGRTYQFGFVEASSPTSNQLSDSGWKTTANGSYTVNGNGNDYVYLIINVSAVQTSNTSTWLELGYDVNEPATIFNLFKFNGYFKATDTATSDLAFSMPAQNLKLLSSFKAQKYDITYNFNDGSGTAKNKTIRYGTTFVADVATPTRNNYVFCGWTVTFTSGKLSDRAQYYETAYNYSTDTPVQRFTKVLSSTMICNNQWTGQVTFKNLCDGEGGKIVLTAQWANNKTNNTTVSSGYVNDTTGLNLNGSNKKEWGSQNATSGYISDNTQLMTNLYGNFTQTVKIYQEACNWGGGTEWDNMRWNTAIIGVYHFNQYGADYTSYYGSNTNRYWESYTMFLQDGTNFYGNIPLGTISNISFKGGTRDDFFGNGKNSAPTNGKDSNGNYKFYEALKRSYVTFTVTGKSVGSKGGTITVDMAIQSVNSNYSGTTYGITYTLSGMDSFPVDLILYGDRTNFVVLSDKLVKGTDNSGKYLSYSSSTGSLGGYITNYSHYVPNVTLSTDMTTKEAYTFEYKHTRNSASTEWSSACWTTPLIVLYDTKDVNKYIFIREDWAMYKSDSTLNVKILDMVVKRNGIADADLITRWNSSTVRITIQKSNSFIHIKWEIGIGSGESVGAYTQDLYLYYTDTSTGLAMYEEKTDTNKTKFIKSHAFGTQVNGTTPSYSVDSIGIMLTGEVCEFEITQPIYPITPTDNIYFDSPKSNYGYGGWSTSGNNTDWSTLDYYSTVSSANISAGQTGKYYMYINSNFEPNGNTKNWTTPLTIAYTGNVSDKNARFYRFDNVDTSAVFGSGNHANLSGGGATDTSVVFASSANYGTYYYDSTDSTQVGNYYNATTSKLLQHGLCAVELSVSSDGTSFTMKRYVSDSYITIDWYNIASNNTTAFWTSYTSNVLNGSIYQSYGLALTCEWASYNIIKGIGGVS